MNVLESFWFGQSCCYINLPPRRVVFSFVGPNAGEMMMSVFWYYRPEQTEVGRLPNFHGEVRLSKAGVKRCYHVEGV